MLKSNLPDKVFQVLIDLIHEKQTNSLFSCSLSGGFINEKPCESEPIKP